MAEEEFISDDKLNQMCKETINKCDVVFEETLSQQSTHIAKEDCGDTIYIEDNNMYIPIYINDTKAEAAEGCDYIDDEINVYTITGMSDELYKSVNYIADETDIKETIITNLKEPYVTNYFVSGGEQESNHYLYCDICGNVYEWFCSKCSMVLHILDSNVPDNFDDRARKTLPGNILEINETKNGFGVYALTSIPKGIKFGPFEGLESVQCTTGSAWRLENGKPVLAENGSGSNWMQYVNCVRNISARNLVVFQHENNLYYRSDREIAKGEELLVYSGVDDGQAYYYPAIEQNVHDVYACTFCSLGFSTAAHLLKHKEHCPFTANKDTLPEEDMVQCAFCKMYLYETEYSKCHMNYCCQKYTRKCKLSVATADQVMENIATVAKQETNHYDESLQNLKQDLSMHLRFKCKICSKLCTEALQTLNTMTRNVSDNDKLYMCSKCANGPSKHSKPYVVSQIDKSYQCTMCKKQFGFKHRLRSHLKYAHGVFITQDSRTHGKKPLTSSDVGLAHRNKGFAKCNATSAVGLTHRH